ncbi:hypothetical protein [Rhodococcoides kyotonense]|uniref:Bacteriocin biosynthesis cyclodehydratase domain-containing protein n=1 Tax=Rhodococcoides kyotonense TaxID=398843 RepID=A0A239LRI8_9NOCA|nr:hypothetical protein [Rhodococcus kyotonensis]SNT33317.1 bacteriocin biosynthesis cyclodehydratase domain-containing protein [Rhodococcus kyotonensis]
MTAPSQHRPLRRPKLRVDAFVQRDGTIRLGWDPDRSFVLTVPADVTPDIVLDVLRHIDGVASRAHLVWYAGTVGMTANVTSTLLSELDEAQLLVECADDAAPDTQSRCRTVRIIGRGPLGDAVQAGLETSSIVVTKSSRPPRELLQYDEGRWNCDLAVLTDDLVPDPQTVTALVTSVTPHLHVRSREGTGIVGPLVRPGISSCLRCLDLERSTIDPQWPHVSAHLFGRVGEASRPTVLATAAIALAQIDAFTRDLPTSLTDTTLEVDLSRNRMTTRHWSRHPRCDCAFV